LSPGCGVKSNGILMPFVAELCEARAGFALKRGEPALLESRESRREVLEGARDTEEPYLSTRTRKRPHARATDTGHARAATQKRRRIPEHAHAKATTRPNNINPGMPSWVISIDPERHSGMPSWVNSIDPERHSWVNTINPGLHAHKFGMHACGRQDQTKETTARPGGSDERALSPPGGEGASSLAAEGWAH
jgi:hypothetical protein